MKIIRVAVLVVILFPALLAEAIEDPRKLDWEKLLPNVGPLDTPFRSLNTEQLIDLETLVGITKMQRRGTVLEVNETLEVAVELRRKMENQELNVDKLVAIYLHQEGEIARRNQMTNTVLNGQIVRMPGYALPLEHKGLSVTELLLVPYVGACIHVPPPPPNQIVYVNLKDPHTLKGIYEPVWITGRLLVKATNQELFFVDGSADIGTAYTLEGVKVEPYEE